jgi:hypothetical protein
VQVANEATGPERIVRSPVDPAWQELDQRARAWGLELCLTIKQGPPLGREGERFHHLDELIVRSPTTGRKCVAVYVPHINGGLDTAVLRALDRLQEAG